MTTALITHRYMARVFLGLAFALLLPACGRSLMVTVVDERSGSPLSHVNVVHGRMEWRFMFILPRLMEIAHGSGQTDANGQIVFENVRDGDVLAVGGDDVDRTWFSPLWPVTETKTDANTKAEQYQRMNANAPPDRLTLPIPRERQHGRSQPVLLTTPQQAAAALYNAIEAEDVAAVRATLVATKKPYTRLADDLALILVTDHRRCRIISQRFPGKYLGDRWADQAAVELSRTALGETKFVVDGNHAKVGFPETLGRRRVQTLTEDMVRVNGQWKWQIDDLPDYGDYPRNLPTRGDTVALTYLAARGCAAMDELLREVESGKLATWEQVEARAKPLREKVMSEIYAELEGATTQPEKD